MSYKTLIFYERKAKKCIDIKKFFVAVFIVLLLFSLCSCSSGSNNDSENPQKVFEWVEVSGGIELTKYTGESTKVVVPEIIDNKVVVSVGTAFSGNVLIEEVELPSSVEIADFQNCKALKRLNAQGIKASKYLILTGCDSLEYLAMPSMTRLPNDYWHLPSSIKEMDISGVEEFILYRFSKDLTSLETLDISGATYIGVGYYSWPSKLKEVKIKDSINGYGIDYDTKTVGDVFEIERQHEGEKKNITEDNKGYVFCELFHCAEIKVNGVVYTNN